MEECSAGQAQSRTTHRRQTFRMAPIKTKAKILKTNVLLQQLSSKAAEIEERHQRPMVRIRCKANPMRRRSPGNRNWIGFLELKNLMLHRLRAKTKRGGNSHGVDSTTIPPQFTAKPHGTKFLPRKRIRPDLLKGTQVGHAVSVILHRQIHVRR